jgi:hypothetical protein
VISYSVGENSTIAIGMPLLRPAVAAGSVAAVNGATLMFAAGTAGQAVSLADGESYYAEVVASVSGVSTAMVGHRFEVDEVATRAATAGKVVLDLGSPLNTAGAAAVAGLTDYRIVVRPHWTLASLFGSGATAKLNAALSASAADQVLAWDGLGFSVYYLRSGATPQWRNVATGTANQDGAILPPGTGLYLRRRASVLAFSVVGEVRTNVFVRPPYAASQLVAGGFPVASSPADWNLVSGAGLTPGTNAAHADQLLNWAGNAFSQYFLQDGAVPQWRSTATGLFDQSRATLFSATGATLLLCRAAATGTPPAVLVQAVPFSL